jgi:transcriptional regulator with XRE-family HTH domain
VPARLESFLELTLEPFGGHVPGRLDVPRDLGRVSRSGSTDAVDVVEEVPSVRVRVAVRLVESSVGLLVSMKQAHRSKYSSDRRTMQSSREIHRSEATGGGLVHIGRSLREARQSRGLSLDDVERATKIRARHLEALEAERFDLLPGGAYTRGFLRSYTDFLGLEGQRFVDEYETRFPDAEPVLEFAPVPLARPLVSRGLKTAAVVVACVGLLGLLAWRLESQPRRAGAPLPASSQAHRLPRQTVPETRTHLVKARRHPVPLPRLSLVAARGDCWLSVHVGDRTGVVLWEGMLHQGTSLHVSRRSVWIRIGAPWNLDVRLNGEPVRTLPANTGNVLVTGAGAKVLAT